MRPQARRPPARAPGLQRSLQGERRRRCYRRTPMGTRRTAPRGAPLLPGLRRLGRHPRRARARARPRGRGPGWRCSALTAALVPLAAMEGGRGAGAAIARRRGRAGAGRRAGPIVDRRDRRRARPAPAARAPWSVARQPWPRHAERRQPRERRAPAGRGRRLLHLQPGHPGAARRRRPHLGHGDAGARGPLGGPLVGERHPNAAAPGHRRPLPRDRRPVHRPGGRPRLPPERARRGRPPGAPRRRRARPSTRAPTTARSPRSWSTASSRRARPTCSWARASTSTAPDVMVWPDHDDHIHVRFADPDEDGRTAGHSGSVPELLGVSGSAGSERSADVPGACRFEWSPAWSHLDGSEFGVVSVRSDLAVAEDRRRTRWAALFGPVNARQIACRRFADRGTACSPGPGRRKAVGPSAAHMAIPSTQDALELLTPADAARPCPSALRGVAVHGPPARASSCRSRSPPWRSTGVCGHGPVGGRAPIVLGAALAPHRPGAGRGASAVGPPGRGRRASPRLRPHLGGRPQRRPGLPLPATSAWSMAAGREGRPDIGRVARRGRPLRRSAVGIGIGRRLGGWAIAAAATRLRERELVAAELDGWAAIGAVLAIYGVAEIARRLRLPRRLRRRHRVPAPRARPRVQPRRPRRRRRRSSACSSWR